MKKKAPSVCNVALGRQFSLASSTTIISHDRLSVLLKLKNLEKMLIMG